MKIRPQLKQHSDNRPAQDLLLKQTNTAISCWKNGDIGKKQREVLKRAEGETTIEAYIKSLEFFFKDLSWVNDMVQTLINLQKLNPFTNIELRSSKKQHMYNLLLHQDRKLSLYLTVIKAHTKNHMHSNSFLFSPYVNINIFVKANNASFEFAALNDHDLLHRDDEIYHPKDGQYYIYDNSKKSMNITPHDRDIVLLRAAINQNMFTMEKPDQNNSRRHHFRTISLDPNISPTIAVADDTVSRAQFMFSILRITKCLDSVILFEKWLTSDISYDMRWYIMREFLALDLKSALPYLTQMSEYDDNPKVRHTATSTLQSITKQYPQLLKTDQKEKQKCPT